MSLPKEVEIGASVEILKSFAVEAKIEVPEDGEFEIADAIMDHLDNLEDNEFYALSETLQAWANGLNQRKNEILSAKAKEKKEKKPKKEKAKATEVSPLAIATEAILAAKTKNDAITAANAFGKDCGLDKFNPAKSWSLAKIQEAAIEYISPKPAEPAKPKQKRVLKADANGKDPDAKAVANAKSAAKKTAEDKKSATQGMVEGEPFRRNTTAWICWDVFNRAKKALTMEEATERFMAEFEKSGLASNKPEGRMPRIIQVMLNDKGILQKNEDGTFNLK